MKSNLYLGEISVCAVLCHSSASQLRSQGVFVGVGASKVAGPGGRGGCTNRTEFDCDYILRLRFPLSYVCPLYNKADLIDSLQCVHRGEEVYLMCAEKHCLASGKFDGERFVASRGNFPHSHAADVEDVRSRKAVNAAKERLLTVHPCTRTKDVYEEERVR